MLVTVAVAVCEDDITKRCLARLLVACIIVKGNIKNACFILYCMALAMVPLWPDGVITGSEWILQAKGRRRCVGCHARAVQN